MCKTTKMPKGEHHQLLIARETHKTKFRHKLRIAEDPSWRLGTT